MELLQKQLADIERQHAELLRLIKAEQTRMNKQKEQELLAFLEKNIAQCRVERINQEGYIVVKRTNDPVDGAFFC